MSPRFAHVRRGRHQGGPEAPRQVGSGGASVSLPARRRRQEQTCGNDAQCCFIVPSGREHTRRRETENSIQGRGPVRP
jgi:hypothetical protein